MVTGMSADPVLDALDALVAAIEENSERNRRVLERAEFLRTQRASGKSWSELVSEESRPLIVEMIGDRRAEAKALHDGGLTMDRIAELFGVTRQRVSALLKATRGSQ
jgi:hypothetical protein